MGALERERMVDSAGSSTVELAPQVKSTVQTEPCLVVSALVK
jgi:hypothetical protein